MANELHLEPGLSKLLLIGPFSAEQTIGEYPRVCQQCSSAPAEFG